MHDAAAVRRRHPAGDLLRVSHGLPQCQRTGGQRASQRLALEQLGHDVRLPFEGAGVVDGDDVGVVERGGRARFLLEALQPRVIRREGRRQDLDRHVAAETQVAGPIYLAHSAGADQRRNLVRSESGTRRKGHVFTILAYLPGSQKLGRVGRPGRPGR